MASAEQTCGVCNKKFDKKAVLHNGKYLHKDCVCCSSCGTTIVDMRVYEAENKIFCRICYIERFIPKCSGCNGTVADTALYVMMLGQYFHQQHSKCSTCSKILIPGKYFPHGGKGHCLPCYWKVRGAPTGKCDICHDELGLTAVISTENVYYHSDCLKCVKCGVGLKNRHFELSGRRYCKQCSDKAKQDQGKGPLAISKEVTLTAVVAPGTDFEKIKMKALPEVKGIEVTVAPPVKTDNKGTTGPTGTSIP